MKKSGMKILMTASIIDRFSHMQMSICTPEDNCLLGRLGCKIQSTKVRSNLSSSLTDLQESDIGQNRLEKGVRSIGALNEIHLNNKSERTRKSIFSHKGINCIGQSDRGIPPCP